MGGLDLPSWRAMWLDYPLSAAFEGVPTGWVLESAEGQIVGYLGNVHQAYDYGGQMVKAAIATSWMVDAAHRAKALQLLITFYKQKNIDLFINGSANQSATKVLAGFKIPRIPIPDYATPCFWAVRPRAFAEAVLRRKSVAGAKVLSLLAGPAIGLWDAARGSGRGSQTSSVQQLKEFGPVFDQLWPRLSSAVPRLRAIRNAAVLNWKYGADLAAGRLVILVAGPPSQADGYALLLRRDASELGMEMFEIVDIQVVGDDPQVFTSLILASIQATREQGADALKLITGTPAKRRPAVALQPYTYELPFWQLYYKAVPGLEVDLTTADAWDFSRFDTY